MYRYQGVSSIPHYTITHPHTPFHLQDFAQNALIATLPIVF